MKNDLFLRHLLMAGKISDSQARELLTMQFDKLEKETIAQLAKKVGLPDNDLLTCQLIYQLQSDELLYGLLCVLRNSSYPNPVYLFLEDLVKSSWPSERNIANIYKFLIPVSDERIDKIVEQHGGKSLDRLIGVTIAICNQADISFFDKLNFWSTACEFIKKESKKQDKILDLNEFRKAIANAATEDAISQIIIDEFWILEFLRIKNYKFFEIVVTSKCWQKARQKQREKWVAEAGVSWSYLTRANKGLGAICWQDIHPKKRKEWIIAKEREEKDKIKSWEVGHSFYHSLFIHEINRLVRLKTFSKESVSSFISFLTMYDSKGTESLKFHMDQWYFGRELFQTMPHEKQFELVYGDNLPFKIAYELKNYCILTFNEWVKLRRKTFNFSNELIIKNTKWENESPRMIKRAMKEFNVSI
ncbi:MAG: hypothetical protein US50_C0013G0006 [Candidatus Nomurabacteria bacterium GW2011_GWB1_37_5]|uniref:Uncharacterized protein n=1 Tax=Candidatus Nomurabacteria bacterium GW2011_GWB1_37_5 TaxID=1618742 RepID=A0A0G0GZM7_9BACT|nr:MAG: hypothetical protein US50_C0013G0006 [Candidatus Nomurabacteria bacterium GW2011_GWB1_37_5]